MKTIYMLIMLLLFSSLAHARIYTWIDENGRKQFGDVIPPQYRGQVDDVRVNIHTPSEEEVNKANARAEKNIKNMHPKENANKQSHKEKSSSNTTAQKENKSADDFESRMEEYRKSQRCFDACSQPIMAVDRFGNEYQRGTDISACGHCKNIVRPTR